MRCALVVTVLCASILIPAASLGDQRIPPRGMAAAGARAADAAVPAKHWVYFRDKGYAAGDAVAQAVAGLANTYDRHAVERRQVRRTAAGVFDERDLPVCERYVADVTATGATLGVQSRWLNAVSVRATDAQLAEIRGLPCVERTEPVRRGKRAEPGEVSQTVAYDGGAGRGEFRSLDYGLSHDQIDQINVIALHDAGYTGAGVRIGILDTGFELTHSAFNDPDHPLNVIAKYDFINNDDNVGQQDGDPWGQFHHGTWILGVIGAYKPGSLVGGAFDASFILCKTEDISGEYPAEEDYYVAGLEFAEQNGADVVTSSLGYIDWYTQADLDGRTAVTTKGVNIATENGVVCCTAAGNQGHDDDPHVSHLLAPADALRVFSCGAVYYEGSITGFSSDGPSADGRIKPEVLARGADTWSVSVWDPNSYDAVSGTSLSTPLVCSAMACLVSAQPGWTVDQYRGRVLYSASDYVKNGQPDALCVRGYGVVNAYAALTFVDCDGNGIDDAEDVRSGSAPDLNGNLIPDGCEHLGDLNCDGGVDFNDIDAFVEALTDRATYETDYPNCDYNRADINGDFSVDFNDIDAFVLLLTY